MSNPSTNQLSFTTTQSGPIIKGVVGTPKPSVIALVSLIDATGSSGAFGTGIQYCNSVLATELPRNIGEVHFALHISRDLDCDRDADFSLGEDMGPDEFVKNVQRIAFEGGGDAEETQLDSCLTIARTYRWPFSAHARRALAVFSSSSSKSTRDGMDAKQVARELAANGIKVIVVAPQGVNLHELAAATGGHSIILSNTPQQQDLDRAIALLTKSLTQVAAGSGTMAMPPNASFGARGTQAI
jgi:hypothetical protein